MLALNNCPVQFFGQVGGDPAGRWIVERLHSSGIDTDNIPVSENLKTGVTVSLTCPEYRMYISYPGTVVATMLEDLPRGYIQKSSHLHLASYFLQAGIRADVGSLLKAARDAGMSTSLDPGGDTGQLWELGELKNFLHYLDFFMPNEDEIMGITGCGNVRDALRSFPDQARCIVVKAGEKGAFIRYDGEIRGTPALPVEVIDTTCAGDCFDAGFLYSLYSGESLDGAVQMGILFGAQAVSSLGLPTENIDAYRESMQDSAD
jgi:sugar/nucleoside kinase (ribokinase family)